MTGLWGKVDWSVKIQQPFAGALTLRPLYASRCGPWTQEQKAATWRAVSPRGSRKVRCNFVHIAAPRAVVKRSAAHISRSYRNPSVFALWEARDVIGGISNTGSAAQVVTPPKVLERYE
ncbi:uncharacterized protein LOC111873638 [Cryptotermes secundus]|uniref:uncharacterized protein LOC111873638 n=1 Tax=Cryptotermes secundus TaxID=105785 RepID=UPI000CD7B925|nr:uncharacterized protein LOC111873638 [Cryptotermes secundus]